MTARLTAPDVALAIPDDAVGLRLCKVKGERLTMCEPVVFERGRAGVELVLRRAMLAGSVGPVGKTGDFWADFINDNGDWTQTVALSREAWNSLKNYWMRCRIASSDR